MAGYLAPYEPMQKWGDDHRCGHFMGMIHHGDPGGHGEGFEKKGFSQWHSCHSWHSWLKILRLRPVAALWTPWLVL